METTLLPADRPPARPGFHWRAAFGARFRKFAWIAGLGSAALLACSPVVSAQTAPATYANFEAAQTSPIRLSADGTRLFAVNTPADMLSVFDLTQPSAPALIAQIPVGIGPVSVAPRSNDEVWVVNQVSDSISIVSVSRGIVTATLSVRDEPADVVFARNRAFVTAARNNRIDVFDLATRQRLTSLPLFGSNPRALAVSPGGSLVYAAFALGGNGTTIVQPEIAPPQSEPTNPELPAPPQVGLIVKANDPLWASRLGYTMPDNDVVVINAGGTTPAIVKYFSGVGTTNFGLAVNPVTGDLWVSNTEARNTVHFEPGVRGHFVDNRVTRINASTGAVVPFELNPTIDYSVLPNPAARVVALAQPTAIAFEPDGTKMYVAAFGTDRVAVVDATGSVQARIGLSANFGAAADPRRMRGPRGLALNTATSRLYVMNRISNTVSVVNTVSRRVVAEVPAGFDPTPPEIKAGRGFLYDAKLSGNGTASCASCHIDGDMDHLAWDLGDPGGTMAQLVQNGEIINFHPMKGPMTTQTLRGLKDSAPLHWRGDRADLAAFNPAFDKLMGGSQLAVADMQAFSTFVDSLLFQPNPYQKLDRTFPASLAGGNPAAGFSHFVTLNLAVQSLGSQPRSCNSCHLAASGPGSDHSINTTDFTQALKIPHLRNLYQKLMFSRAGGDTIDGFGLDHDGRVGGLLEFFQGRAFSLYTAQQKLDIGAFVRAFDTGTAPAVGYTFTFTATNIDSTAALQSIQLLGQQAFVRNIDLIGRGTLNGVVHGLLYLPNAGVFITDQPGLGPFTAQQLDTLIRAGDTLSMMGVYPGTGTATLQQPTAPAAVR